MSIEIPKTNCKGCDARDRMLRNMSSQIDQHWDALIFWRNIALAAESKLAIEIQCRTTAEIEVENFRQRAEGLDAATSPKAA